MTSPKCQISTLELSPCDNYRPATIFLPCPEVVIISDKHWSSLLNCTKPLTSEGKLLIDKQEDKLYCSLPLSRFSLRSPCWTNGCTNHECGMGLGEGAREDWVTKFPPERETRSVRGRSENQEGRFNYRRLCKAPKPQNIP